MGLEEEGEECKSASRGQGTDHRVGPEKATLTIADPQKSFRVPMIDALIERRRMP